MFAAAHKKTDTMYAVKHIKKYEAVSELFTWEQEEKLLLREVETLKRVTGCSKGSPLPLIDPDTPIVVELVDVYEDDDDIFLVFELCALAQAAD